MIHSDLSIFSFQMTVNNVLAPIQLFDLQIKIKWKDNAGSLAELLVKLLERLYN